MHEASRMVGALHAPAVEYLPAMRIKV